MKLIDVDALMSKAFTDERGYNVVYVDDILKEPTVDAEPIKHGRWIDVTTPLLAIFGDCRYKCSSCGYYLDHKPNIINGGKGNAYCDCCGAKMDRGMNNENDNQLPL